MCDCVTGRKSEAESVISARSLLSFNLPRLTRTPLLSLFVYIVSVFVSVFCLSCPSVCSSVSLSLYVCMIASRSTSFVQRPFDEPWLGYSRYIRRKKRYPVSNAWLSIFIRQPMNTQTISCPTCFFIDVWHLQLRFLGIIIAGNITYQTNYLSHLVYATVPRHLPGKVSIADDNDVDKSRLLRLKSK